MKKQAFIKSFYNLQCHLKDFFHLYSLCIAEREMMHDIIQSKSMSIYQKILDFSTLFYLQMLLAKWLNWKMLSRNTKSKKPNAKCTLPAKPLKFTVMKKTDHWLKSSMTFLGEEFSHAFNLKDDDPLKKRKKYRKWHDFQHPLTCSLLDCILLSSELHDLESILLVWHF